MEEIFKDIEGYEGLYQVSNLGRVKSLERLDSRGHKVNERILRLKKNRYGYLQVTLYINGKGKTIEIHRLVAIHFLPNPNNLPEVNHIDENKENNSLENLEWCDHSYNINFGNRNKRVSESIGKGIDNHWSKPIVQLDSQTNKLINVWGSGMEAEREGGFYNSNINKCCNNKFNRKCNNIYKGYKWQYLSDYIHSIDPRIKKVVIFEKEYQF